MNECRLRHVNINGQIRLDLGFFDRNFKCQFETDANMCTQLKRKQPILQMCKTMYSWNCFQQAIKSSNVQDCCVYIVNDQACFITKPLLTVQSVQF